MPTGTNHRTECQVSAHPQSKPSLYDQLCALPEGLRGEIINGQLRTQPRPAGPHSLATSRLGGDLEAPYGRGRGGPGGWWILDEPEIHLVRDQEVVVPDLAGWRRERMPRLPEGHRFEVVPDWVCEVLSSSTKSTDREEKMPLYARYGVAYGWLVDPRTRTLERIVWPMAGGFRSGSTVTTTRRGCRPLMLGPSG